jgi:hypothetical protein
LETLLQLLVLKKRANEVESLRLEGLEIVLRDNLVWLIIIIEVWEGDV